MRNYLFLLVTFLLFKTSYGQQAADENKAKMATVLENYFDLEREAIHLHLDKTTFITNEKIWYKGYIINRKTNKPFFTTNVYVLLYDEKGKQLSEDLVYASNGTFSGKIDLESTMHSGNYYIQVYTNWMNNFSENESTITKINIINPTEGIKKYTKINTQSLEVFLNPEGQHFISGVGNIVGVQVKDCRGNALENLEASLENNHGEVLKTFKLNAFGLGKFEVPATDEPLKVTIVYNNKKYEKQLPSPESLGFAIEVNDFTFEGKTMVKIKSNIATSNVMASKKIYLLAHQDQKYTIYDIQLNADSEQLISINNNNLFEGITTLRIIDSDLKEWCERLLYIHPNLENATTSITKSEKTGGNIKMVGKSPFNNASISLAILPEATKSLDENNNIISGLTINPYLNDPLPNANYYFDSPSRLKFYGLDLALLNQEKPKYLWSFMKTTTPTANYTFDIGLSLKGTIDNQIANKTYHKVKLISHKDFIMMSADVDDKGNYLFEHVLLADSTFVSMSLQKLPDFDVIKTKLTPQVINRKKPYYKPFQIVIPENCLESEIQNLSMESGIPKFSSNTIMLKEVKIIVPKKKLTYENNLGNASLRAFKVDDMMERQNLLVFIESNGFNVVRNGLDVTVYSRNPNSIMGEQSKPQIIVDGRTLKSHYDLTLLSMSEIDEIYLDPKAIIPSMNNNQGIIKIYTKKGFSSGYTPKQDPNSFYLKEGFTRYFGFKNADYESTQSVGFENYGLIHWATRIISDENGQFYFEIPDYNKPKGRIKIEGMTDDGKLFYEEKIIDLQ